MWVKIASMLTKVLRCGPKEKHATLIAKEDNSDAKVTIV